MTEQTPPPLSLLVRAVALVVHALSLRGIGDASVVLGYIEDANTQRWRASIDELRAAVEQVRAARLPRTADDPSAQYSSVMNAIASGAFDLDRVRELPLPAPRPVRRTAPKTRP